MRKGDVLDAFVVGDARPVSAEVQAELVEPLTSGVRLTFQEMLGAEASLRAAYLGTGSGTLGDVAAVIRLHGAVEGALVVHFPESGAAAAATRMLAGAVDEITDELVRDCVGEVANVIAGQGKSLLGGTRHGYTFRPPTVVSGADQPTWEGDGRRCLVMVFASDLGDFALQLCMKSV